MKSLHWLLFAPLFALTCFAGKDSSQLVGVDDRWHYLNSEHFEIYSHQSDGNARSLLHNLEILRAVFFEQLKLKERLHVDVTIYAFRSEKEFLAYAPQMFQDQSSLGGFHFFQDDRAVIVLPPADDETLQETIFHEYVHHLFRIAEEDPPLWYNEGTADVFGGMKVEREKVYIGTPFVGRVAYLRTQTLIPLGQLFAADQSSKVYFEQDHTGVFYAESWAFVHYLHFGRHSFSKEAVDRFLTVALDRERLGKVDLEAVFKSCFGCDYQEMEYQLRRYIMTGSYSAFGVPMPKLAAASSYLVRPVPIAEARLRLAELSVRVLQSGLGELVLLDAESKPPVDPRVFEALGADALRKGDDRIAEERWEEAVAAGSKNPAIVRELGLLEGHKWFNQFNQNLVLPDEVATRLRDRLQRSLKLEPLQGASYEMLAWVESFSRSPDPENVKMVTQHVAAIRDKRRTLIALCQLMIRSRNADTALLLLNALDGKSLKQNDQVAVNQMHAEYNAMKEELAASGDTSAAPTEQNSTDPNTTTLPSTPEQGGAAAPSVPVPDNL
jgi:hypothetical protein